MANTKITNHIVDSTVITGQTAVTAADGDYILVADASDSNALKKVLASDLIQSSEEISDIVGAMVSSNTESGIAVAYQDSDNTLDFTVGAAQSSITSLGTLSALTISGDLIVDTDTLKVTSGSDLVHIGNTSTGFHSSVHPLIVGSGSGDEGMTIFSGSSNKGKLGFADAASDDTGSYRGYIQYDHNGDKMNIGTAGGTRMHINDAGDVGIGTDTLNKFFNLADPNEGAETLKLHFEAAASTDSWAIYPYDRTNSHYPNLHLGANAAIKVKNTGAVDMQGGTLYVHQDGEVGIGTTSPGRLLEVSHSAGAHTPVLRLTGTHASAYSGGLEFYSGYGPKTTAEIYSTASGSQGGEFWLNVRSQGSNAMSRVLSVDNASRTRLTSVAASASGALNIMGEVGNSYDAVQFYHNSSTLVGRIRTAASSTSYNTSSDYRLKENVDYTWDATTRLKQLKPARFNFTADDTNTLVDGFLAHEVSSIVPEAITGEKDAIDEDGNPDYQGIDQSKLVPLLVKTIQELEARITTLEG